MLFLRPLLLLLLSLFAPLPALCEFLESDISGSYILEYSNPSCAEKLTISKSSLQIKASEVLLESSSCEIFDSTGLQPCSGGRINLQPDILVGTAAQLYFGEHFNETGSFLSGPTSTSFKCECFTIEENAVIVLLKPDFTMQRIRWEDVFIGDNEIGSASKGGTVDFEKGVKYIIMGSSCFYRELESEDRAACFPGNSRVVLQDGAVKPMSQVCIGDRVQVGPGKYSSIFGWTHCDKDSIARFVRVTLSGGEALVATGGHYVYVKGGLKRMQRVQTGDWMRTSKGGWGKVIGVDREIQRGIFNPQTVHGDIVVNGIVCTTYTEAVEPVVAHALLAPLRALHPVLWRWTGWGWSLWSESWRVP